MTVPTELDTVNLGEAGRRSEGKNREMLTLVDKFLTRIRVANDTTSVIELLADIASTLGFRSGILIAYKSGIRELDYILDSDASRGDWWATYVQNGLRERAMAQSESLRGNTLVQMRADRFSSKDDPAYLFLKDHDLVECLAVPVSDAGEVIGAAVFSGDAPLDEQQQMALQLIVYNLFAQVRSFNGFGIHAPAARLTPREREVMRLVADGKTSSKIATELTLSARTVNQHIENVATKLGTKNRVQTAAEAIRFGLLH